MKTTALALGLAAGLSLLAFVTTGGFDPSVTVSSANTWAEIVLTLLGAVVVSALLLLGARAPAWGGATVAAFVVLTALTAASIAWSVQPDASWQAANLTLAYLATFAGAAAAARLAPHHWRALTGAIALMTLVVSGYALLAKVFPASLAAGDAQGRLQAPLGYWNATGALAAMGLGPSLWALTRAKGGPMARGLAVPAVAILASVVVLSYSRSAVVVAILVVGGWLALVPGRLRACAMLAPAGAGTALICAWALSHSGLSADGVSLAARTAAGHTFGAVLVAVVAGLGAGGVGLAIAGDRISISEVTRRRVGALLLAAVALLPVAGVVVLALSTRGLTGEISHAWSTVTSVNSGVGNSSTRLTQFGSSRPLYWSQGLKVGEHALLHGVGALGYATARTRYTTDPHIAGHAHSYVVQTFADLGLIGLAVNLALLVGWARGAGAAIAVRSRWAGLDAEAARERQGLLALVVVVVAFGLVSAVDWTWYFPGVTVPALVAAGWLTGRGPLLRPVGATSWTSIFDRPARAAIVTAVAAVALLGAWLTFEPLRSAQSSADALTAPTRAAAFRDARTAAAADPLALQPHLVLSALYRSGGETVPARAQLQSAVALQPENPASWLALGLFDLQEHHPRRALPSLRRSLVLDPTSVTTVDALAQARAALAARGG